MRWLTDSMDMDLSKLQELVIYNEKQTRLVKNGNAFAEKCPDGTYRVYASDGEFLALCRAENGKVSTIKSFFEV